METDRIKWNNRFASQDYYLGMEASPFLQREIARIKVLAPGPTALDIACGEGRNSLFLASHGFKVTGLDISDIGLSKAESRALAAGFDINFKRVDLEGHSIEGSYDLILNFNFLLRELIPLEIAALNPGGLLLFDTILASEQLMQAHNPKYLLNSGELSNVFSIFGGTILFSEERHDDGIPTARLLFRKNHPSDIQDQSLKL